MAKSLRLLVVELLLLCCATPSTGVLTLTPETITVNVSQPGLVERNIKLANTGSTSLDVSLRLSNALGGTPGTPDDTAVPQPPSTGTGNVPGELLPDPVPDPPAAAPMTVRQAGSTTCKLMVRLRNRSSGNKLRRRLAEDPNLPVKSWQHCDMVGIDIVDLDCPAAGDEVVGKSIEYLRGHYAADIEFVEEDHLVHATQFPNEPSDTSWSAQWGMRRIGMPRAWTHYANTGQVSTTPVTVAVIDTGVQLNHADLAANLWVNSGEIPGNGIDDDANGFVDDVHGWDFADNDADPSDSDGHGTHCAGVIAAVTDNALGVAGVAGLAPVRIMALRFLGEGGSGTTSDAVQSINYALQNGAKISSNSWGSLTPGGSPSLTQIMRSARDQGHLFVSAAGNEGADVDRNLYTPCALSEDFAICVASTTSIDTVSSFSNYGATTVHIAAPGSDIFSTVNGGTYESYSGTSMATPHVSGAAALLWAAQGHLTLSQVREVILSTAERTTWLQGTVSTGGLLDVAKLMEDSRGWLHFVDPVPGNLSTSMQVSLGPGEEVDLTLAVGFETQALAGHRSLDVVAQAGSETATTRVAFILEGRPELVPSWGSDTLNVDFGTVFVDATATRSARVSNLGNANAHISVTRPQPPFGCSPAAHELRPGAEVDFELTCTPASAGTWEAVIEVTTSDQLFMFNVRCAGLETDSLALDHFSGAVLHSGGGSGRHLQPCIPAAWEPHLSGDRAAGLLVMPVPSNPEGCQAHQAGSLTGQVLLVARGTCSFHLKALQAQEAGAVGLLIEDNEAPTTVSVLPIVTELALPQIPAFLTSAQQGSRLRLRAAAGTETVSMHWKPVMVWNGHPAQVSTSITLSNVGVFDLIWNSSTYLDFGDTQNRFYTAKLAGNVTEEPIPLWSRNLGSVCYDGSDDTLEVVQLPFRFPFYGRLVEAVAVSSNGYLSFDTENSNSHYHGLLPSIELPNGLIAPYWTDMVCRSGSHLTMSYLPAQGSREAAVEFRFADFGFWGESSSGSTATVAVQLFVTGQVNVAILDTPIYRSGVLVGLETLDGRFGGNYAAHIQSLPQPFTIEFLPWLVNVGGSSGVLEAGTNGTIEITAPGGREGQGWLSVTTQTDAEYRVRVSTKTYSFRWSAGSWEACDGTQRTRVLECLGSDDVVYTYDDCTQRGVCLDQQQGWVDSVGNPCSNYAANSWCTDTGGYGVGWNALWGFFSAYASSDGHTAATACCACGAGEAVPLPVESCGNSSGVAVDPTSTSSTSTKTTTSASSTTTSQLQPTEAVTTVPNDSGGDSTSSVLVTGSMNMQVGEANAADFVADPDVKTAIRGTIAEAAGVAPEEVLGLSLRVKNRRRLNLPAVDLPHSPVRLLQSTVEVVVTYSIQALDESVGDQVSARIEAVEPVQMSQRVQTAVEQATGPNTYSVQVTSVATPGVTAVTADMCPTAPTTDPGTTSLAAVLRGR